MNRKVLAILACFLLVASSLGACIYHHPLAKGKINVAVSIAPYGDIVRQIGGSRVSVAVLVPPGRTPHDYEPSPRLMVNISRSDAYFSCGSGIDVEIEYLNKILSQNNRIKHFDLSKNVNYIMVVEANSAAYTPDPHVWTSLDNVQIIAQNIYAALSQLDPSYQEYFEQNLCDFCQRTAQLKSDISQLFAGMSKDTFLIYHGSFIYFAEDFGLNQIAIKEEGKEVTPAHLAAVIDQAKLKGLTMVYVERDFPMAIASVVAHEIGGKLYYLDAVSDDYLNSMWQNALALYEGLK